MKEKGKNPFLLLRRNFKSLKVSKTVFVISVAWKLMGF